MTDKELKRLRRSELLEMLLAQSRELQRVQSRLEEVEAELRRREIVARETGSIAEAALRLNGVFEAAQAAGEQYVESVRALEQRQQALVAETEARCAAMLASAQREAQTSREVERDGEDNA